MNSKQTKIPAINLITNINIKEKTIEIGMANSIIFHDFPISANFPANELDCTTELNYD